MKKLLALFAVALISVVGAFAFDVSTVRGTWVDETYDADWTFNSDGTIVLSYHSTGAVIYTFNDSNVKNFRVSLSNEGGVLEQCVVIQFRCDETHRDYKFTCPAQPKPALRIEFAPDWSKALYRSSFPWVKGAVE
ncbi:MAG: hypothetical protein K6G18_15675 [Treponema sp.]|nr:hypothetical protein [Treponema sp.]